jgi:hypothetical protein
MNVTSGDRLMEKIAGELGLSECGKSWATIALDPYHDTPVEPYSGYPDNNEAPSVQQIVKSSYSINSNFITTNYDAHICWLPWQSENVGRVVSSMGDYSGGSFPLYTTTFVTAPWGGLMVDIVGSGTPTFNQNSSNPQQLDGQIALQYCVNDWRLVGVGFEVINTTSDLNIQGLVTCYRQPVPQRSSKSSIQIWNYTAATAPRIDLGYASAIVVSAPPGTIANAMLLPGSVQWKAKEGAYVVPTLNSTSLVSGEDQTSVITNDNSPVAIFRGIGANGSVNPGNASFNTYYAAGCNLTDFNMAGAYFTGLSASTTLTVNVIHYFERFPAIDSPTDLALVVLAKPSCRFDPKALELYSAVIRHMPVGVPQRFNGLGDWFREAVQTARDIVSPVLSAIPHPIAMMGAGVLNGIAGNITKKYGNEEEKSMPAPGRVYNAQGNQSSVAKKKPSVASQFAKLGIVKKNPKKKKKQLVEVVKMVKK